MTARYDVVVIGGGINGVGVAQAAAAGGYSVLLLEREALACGTSSRSSKLIHGGLRYLESFELNLVYEALRERRLLLQNAPGLVRLVPFHIPIYRETTRRATYVRLGLTVYASLARDAGARFARLPAAHWAALDGVETQGLEAVFRYYDAQTDDAALTRAVMRSAMALGAELTCPARFVAAERRADGYDVVYDDGNPRACRAGVLVNAAGPWAPAVAASIRPAAATLPVELVQGSHVVLAGAVRAGCYYLEAADRRAVFVMPWQGATLVGTTETPFAGDPAEAIPRPAEIEYLRATFSRYFPRQSAEVRAAFAGVRVLPCRPGPVSGRSREVLLGVDDDAAPRLVTVYGGKLTAYRRTAAKVLRRVRRALGPRRPRADTAKLPLAPD